MSLLVDKDMLKMRTLGRKLPAVLIIVAAAAQSKDLFELPDGTMLEGVSPLKGGLPRGTTTIIGLTLDRSSSADLIHSLGPPTAPARTTDPHQANVICYAASDDSTTYLSFETGWLENPTDKLTSFTLSRGKSWHSNVSCARSSRLAVSLSTANGLRLGLTQTELRQRVGVSSKTTPEWVVYMFERYQAFSKSDRAKAGRAPGGGEYKGVWTYEFLIGHFAQGRMDMLSISTSGETDW